MRRPALLIASALLAASALVLGFAVAPAANGDTPTAADTAPATAGLPAVYPVPQSMHTRGHRLPLAGAVGLVVGPGSDASAVGAVRAVVGIPSVKRIDVVSAVADLTDGETAIFVGGEDENPATGPALVALGVEGAGGMAAEGYVLATGVVDGHPSIVLDGHDAAGTFYAAQTLRQLVRGASVPGVEVRDWPAFPLRGVIEGFYGTPWSHQARLDQLDFYGEHKMNTYVYSPKDDPYLRAQWRDPYPPDQLAQLKELVDRAIANHVQFTYALSPGLSVCYSSPTDEQALVAKFQSLWDVGVRDFAIPLDDISYTTWNCSQDRTTFGSGGAAAGQAQAYLLNAVQRDFIAAHPGAARLEMVPTEYADVSASPYKNALKAALDPAIVVEWTGVGVIAAVITSQQAAAAKSVYGHDILVWDNYPVNDYVTNRLLLGPYVGRDAGLAGSLYGITANPMIEPYASKVALFNVADYTWNDTAYNADASWQASIAELAGSDPEVQAALAAFADLEHYSQIDPVQAPALAAKLARFWPAWESGETDAATVLDAYLQTIQAIPSTLDARMADRGFVADAQPWLASAGYWGQAARAALRMLVDERAGDGAAAVADRAQARSLVTTAKSFQYTGLNGTVNVTVGDGVIDTFVNRALAENDRWLGVAGRHITAITSMPTYQSYLPANMVDGDDSTFFWSSRAPGNGDYIGVDLGSVEPISSVTIHMSKTTSPNDYIHAGVLEYSADGSTWTPLGTFTSPNVSANVPAGTQARYVRLRNTGSQPYWVVAREFTVTGPANAEPTVTGTPAGTSLAAAADGNPDTAYTAASSPAAGDALTVTLPAVRPIDRVAVAGTGSGEVQLGDGTTWHTIGALQSGYTELPAGGEAAGEIRLVWTAGSPPPVISEVVPWYADAPVADLLLTPQSLDMSVGDSAQLTVSLSATRPETQAGTLDVAAPTGVIATPSSTSLTVLRGAQLSVPVTFSAAVPGTYRVPISFGSVSRMLTIRVHPQVSSTNVALGAVATASSVEQNLPQFTPDHATDGDLTTRWSSGYSDGEWLQLQFAAPQHLGKIVIVWEAAHANAYRIETSADGQTWTDAADVTSSQGGTETIWIDQSDVGYLRMQGVSRATQWGYSIYELEAYPIMS